MHVQLIPIDKKGHPTDVSGRLDMHVKQVCKATAELYRSSGFLAPWIGYLAVYDRRLVGACAFKSPPKKDGDTKTVEIGYLTFPKFEGQGIATEMVRELLHIAQASDSTLTVVAETENEENASNAILKKFGFQFVGAINNPEDGELWQWQWTNPKQAKKQVPGNSHV